MGDDILINLLCEMSEMEIDRIRKRTEMVETEFGYMPSTRSGRQIMMSIRHSMDEFDIEEFGGFDLVDLMVKNNRCHGAVFRKGENLVTFVSGSTILATGGYSNSVGVSDNLNTVDGVGINAAFRSGATLLNPEFVMTHPFGIRYTKNIIAGRLLEYPDIVDEFGVRVLPEHLEKRIRKNDYHHQLAEISAVFANKISEGSKIFLDCNSISDVEIKKLANSTVYGRSLKLLKNGLLEVNPIYHYSLGGLKIDRNGQTTIDGLYAAGEIAGGLHGSSRLGGNAIAEALVLGKVAGEAAALADRAGSTRCEVSSFPVPKTNMRIVKDASYLSDSIKAESDIFIKSIFVSSLEREESVGCFIRSDFSEKAPRSKNHHVYLKGGSIRIDQHD